MKKCIVFFLLGICQLAQAYPSDRAIANLTEDYGDCIAYFTVMTAYAQKQVQSQPDLAWSNAEAGYKKASADAIGQLRTIMIDMQGLPDKYVMAKLDLHMQIIQKTLGEEGVDRLMFLYMNQCKALVENPIPRLQYWMDK